MSEEEKEAIEYLKGKFEFFEEDDTLAKWDYEAINTMLNLIDKLQEELKDSINARFELQRRIDKTQKENAELKEEIDNLIEENHKHIDYIADMKKKHEDKIRTKIKELEEKYKKHEKEGLYGFADKLDIGTRIDVLRELLGDE